MKKLKRILTEVNGDPDRATQEIITLLKQHGFFPEDPRLMRVAEKEVDDFLTDFLDKYATRGFR